MLEFHELAALLNLDPLRPATKRFIDDGVKKGKYMVVPHPELPDEVMYLKKKWSKIFEHQRERSQHLDQKRGASLEEVKSFRSLTGTPLMETLSGNGAKGPGSGKRPLPEQANDDEDDGDDSDGQQSTVSKKDHAKAKKETSATMGKIQTAIAAARGGLNKTKSNSSSSKKNILEAVQMELQSILTKLEVARTDAEDFLAQPPSAKKLAVAFKSVHADIAAATDLVNTVEACVKNSS